MARRPADAATKRKARRQYVHDLDAKLSWLVNIHWSISWEQFYDESGVPKTSIQDAIGRKSAKRAVRGNKVPDSQLGRDHQLWLAEYFGFSTRWKQWREPEMGKHLKTNRPDTAAAFMDWYEPRAPEKLKPRIKVLKTQGIEQGSSEGTVAERSTSDRLKIGELRQPVLPIEGLARIELNCEQTDVGATSLGVSIDCDEAEIEISQDPLTLRHAAHRHAQLTPRRHD